MKNDPYFKLRHIYKVKVNFTRRFIKGELKGLTHFDSIPFISFENAMDWINGVQSNSDAGNLDYVVDRLEVVANN